MESVGAFELCLYTDVIFGKDTEVRTGELVKKHGGTKVLIVYGGGSIKKIGLYDRVVTSLQEAGVPFFELSGVQPNPRRSLCDEGVILGKKEGIDFVLGIGGGSVLDSAKAISYGIAYEGDDWWDLFSHKAKPVGRLPVGSIHTIASSGSEGSTTSAILDDVSTGEKLPCSGPMGRPVFAIMNPELTYSVNPYQTAAGTTDILAHTLERYFVVGDECALGDAFAEGLMQTTIEYGSLVMREPNSYRARAELMLCGMYSHNGITGIGRAGERRGPHAIEDCMSSAFDTSHSAGIAVIMPPWLRQVADGSETGCARVAKLAINVFGVQPDVKDFKRIAYEGIYRFRGWLDSIGMPRSLTELGFGQDDIKTLVEKSHFNDKGLLIGNEDFDRAGLEAFFRSLL